MIFRFHPLVLNSPAQACIFKRLHRTWFLTLKLTFSVRQDHMLDHPVKLLGNYFHFSNSQ